MGSGSRKETLLYVFKNLKKDLTDLIFSEKYNWTKIDLSLYFNNGKPKNFSARYPYVKDNEGRTLLDISAGVARPGALVQRAPLDQEIVNLLVEFTKKHRRIDGNVSAYLEESEQVPAHSKEETSLCPYCGRPASRLGTLGRYYCFSCKRYV